MYLFLRGFNKSLLIFCNKNKRHTMKTPKLKKLMLNIAIMTVAFLLSGTTFAWAADIRGTVRYDDGSGVSSVRVSCSGGSDYTGSGGDYEISYLDDGSYYVSASKSGFSFSPSSQRVTISNGWDESGVNFTTPTFAIAGTVRWSSGEGIGYASVTAIASGCSGSDMTDSSGRYEIEDLHNDKTYSVSVSKAGIYFNPSSDSVSIRGSSKGGIDFLAPMYAISGHVVYDTGGGVNGVSVSCGGLDSDTTDSNGFYVIGDLPDRSSYTVGAYKYDTEITPSTRNVFLMGGSEGGVNFTVITPKSNISGFVRDAAGGGVNDATVTIDGNSTAPITLTTSGTAPDDGYYGVGGLPSDTYTITASMPESSYDKFYPIGGYVETLNAQTIGRDFTAIITPTADFTVSYDPTSSVAPVTATFTNTSGGDIDTYLWDFGDSNTSNLTSPSHLYNQYGDYTVRLTTTGPYGDSDWKETVVSALALPNAVLTPSSAVVTEGGSTVVLDGSTSSDPDGTITRNWSIEPGGDGGTISPSSGNQTTFTSGNNSTAGTLITTVKLTVTDDDGLEDTATADITINRPPILASIGDKYIMQGVNLSFTISASDLDNDTRTYSASNLPPGASFNAGTRTFSWTPTGPQMGTYTNVHFQVTDGYLQDSEDITIQSRFTGGFSTFTGDAGYYAPDNTHVSNYNTGSLNATGNINAPNGIDRWELWCNGELVSSGE